MSEHDWHNRIEMHDVAGIEAASDAMRAVIRKLRTTNAPPEVLAKTRAALEELADELAPYVHEGPYGQHALSLTMPNLADAGDAARFFPYSPVIGPRNPISPPVRFESNDGVVTGEVVFAPQYNGPPRSVHGGVIALVLDELLGYTGVVNECGAFTGTLTVRYLHLTPIGERITMRARIRGREGRKVFIAGALFHGETRTAEAEGIFVRPSVPEMARESV